MCIYHFKVQHSMDCISDICIYMYTKNLTAHDIDMHYTPQFSSDLARKAVRLLTSCLSLCRYSYFIIAVTVTFILLTFIIVHKSYARSIRFIFMKLSTTTKCITSSDLL